MTDKQKIKEEIERLRDIDEETSYLNKESFNSGRWKALTQIKAFIDSLPEEPVNEDLEDAAYHFCLDEFGNPKESLFKFDQRCFIAGAEWQRKQDQETIELAEDHAMLAGMNKMKEEMMKDAVDATILDIDAQTIEFGLYPEKLLSIKEGDKVKIIIVKED